MWWINAKRIIKYGSIGFIRNSFVSLSTILVMTITLFVIGSLIFIGAILTTTLNQVRDKVDVNVYFVTTAPEGNILSLKKSIEALPEVKSVEYISKEQALEAFRMRHQNDQLTLQALDELDENPLGASLSIRAKETSQYEGIAKFLESDAAVTAGETPIIEKINFFQNKAAIDRLTRVIDSSEQFGLAIIIFLLIASVMITLNTIRLAIYTARDEISVMKLVGAENSYVRGPFVFEGVLYGVVAGIVTLVLFYPLTLWLGPITEGFFNDINIFQYYLDNFGQIFLIIMGTGIFLGAVSSYLAVRRYLKV
ncbi:ABC transporter permease [Candidatus Kaiserbacteria bacterium]|nr:ABC transporter permease [Candidatus Kaiserbacteria bacterium]